MTHIDQMAGFI